MYHRHICIKHLSKSQEEILIALDWECLTECFIKRKAARHPPDSAHSPRAGWDKLPFCIPNLLPLTAVGGNFYTDFIRIRFFKEILYSEAVHMSFHLAHFLFFFSSYLFPFFFFFSFFIRKLRSCNYKGQWWLHSICSLLVHAVDIAVICLGESNLICGFCFIELSNNHLSPEPGNKHYFSAE